MNIETYRHMEAQMKAIEQALGVMWWNYVHNAPENKEWGIKACEDIRLILKKQRLCNYSSLSWQDSEKIDQENQPKQEMGRGAFGATYTGD